MRRVFALKGGSVVCDGDFWMVEGEPGGVREHMYVSMYVCIVFGFEILGMYIRV